MRREHFIPKLSNRQSRAQWEESGRPNIEQKARAKAKEILKSHKPLGIPRDLDEQVRRAFPQIRA
jgi:trimethylamine:corrinoid methyltransferase-like protein